MSDTQPQEGTEPTTPDEGTEPTTFTIKSPNPDYTGTSSSVDFRNGVGYTQNRLVAISLFERGYDVSEGGEMIVPVPQSIEPSTLGHAPFSRDAAILGSAAAGPVSDAFLPPIGAGEGKDPHGEQVVSPGIHGLAPAPLVPGEVSRDPETQEAKESEAAKAVLIDNEPVPEGTADWKGDDTEAAPAGPLGLSDPASEGKGPDAGLERPKANASKDEWVAYAVAKGMPREEAETLSRGGIIEHFPEEQ